MTWYESPLVVAIATGIFFAIPTAYALWRSKAVDAATKQTTTDSSHTAHVALAQAALESVIKALQEDNRVVRGERDYEREINRLRLAKDVVSEAKDRIAVIENGGIT